MYMYIYICISIVFEILKHLETISPLDFRRLPRPIGFQTPCLAANGSWAPAHDIPPGDVTMWRTWSIYDHLDTLQT